MTGTWTQIQLAGHPCDIYEPPQQNPHGYAVLYLHGVQLASLAENEVYTAEFARHRLPLMAPLEK